MFLELPFYFKVHDTAGNGGYPQSFRFDIYFDETLRMYRQQGSQELNELLRKVYEEGSLVEGSLSNESGKPYLFKLVEYIDAATRINGKNILEIGCGSGTLLKELKKRKANVLGLEPGSHVAESDIADIKIIKDFFPSPQITGRFDAIVHYGVMEHIEDPVLFLKQQMEFLSPDGKIIISVPNCEPFLETGDISILIHEHFNYFTRESIAKVVLAAGLTPERIEIFEGVILAVASRSNKKTETPVPLFDKERFEGLIASLNKKVDKLLTGHAETNVAVYAPFRAMNALFIANRLSTRLVDDNSHAKGKYLPCFVKPIENFDELKNNPPACILIYSRTFGERIKEKCRQEPSLQLSEILTLNDLD